VMRSVDLLLSIIVFAEIRSHPTERRIHIFEFFGEPHLVYFVRVPI
jgi:hypothetical protein